MFAMSTARAFSVSGEQSVDCVSCNASGVFIGDIPLLEKKSATAEYASWAVRPITELNAELTFRYRLPIDIASRTNALALIAHALNRRDFAMAAIAAVQMRLPKPPPLAKGGEAIDDLRGRAAELRRCGLLKIDPDWDAKHPRAGIPPNPGWFAPLPNGPEAARVWPAAMVDDK